MWVDPTTRKVFRLFSEIRAEFPQTSFHEPISDEEIASVGLLPLQETSWVGDPSRERKEEALPWIIDGKWVQQWRSVALSEEEIKEAQAKRIDALWRAADAYVSNNISGTAIGILTIGVLSRLPKALAVTKWVSDVWDEYYRRKALVASVAVDDLDFSSFGQMPFSFPELREELGL